MIMVAGPFTFFAATSNSRIQIARCPWYVEPPVGSSLLMTYVFPSSSKKIDGSIPPTSGIHVGFDQGPAGFVAVTR
jgi:hypothetical protein